MLMRRVVVVRGVWRMGCTPLMGGWEEEEEEEAVAAAAAAQ
jgi:hypothetical protein